MSRLLVVLCPPRSFSSLISTMIGQHPEIYGFPELHLMIRETVGEVLAWERKCERFTGPPGLLRVIAELDHGGQTARNVLKAANWIEDRSDWKSAWMLDYCIMRATEASGARYCLEKSPSVAFLPSALERMRAAYPNALYVHVTRHPLGLKKSLEEFVRESRRFTDAQKAIRLESAMTAWPVAQRNLLDFTASLAPGQYIRIRGEDVLSDAMETMRQIAAWLGLRTDDEAVGAMLRPEESPYASLGPPNAAFGNDPKFIDSPAFRPGNPRLRSIDTFLEETEEGQAFDPRRSDYLKYLASCLGYQ